MIIKSHFKYGCLPLPPHRAVTAAGLAGEAHSKTEDHCQWHRVFIRWHRVFTRIGSLGMLQFQAGCADITVGRDELDCGSAGSPQVTGTAELRGPLIST